MNQFLALVLPFFAGIIALSLGIWTFTQKPQERLFINPWVFSIAGAIMVLTGIVNYFLWKQGLILLQ